ncbi:unnamed protein product [Triticum turgidum subsp. durum]|uniref:Ribosomal protein L35A n=1 Tax=Triticum turgidum subsp. durum TaxID=4567 RepID=A0A9R0VEA8_TRITD|nr:unnamed protein product [Triticum turgidum subsp. durum]
MSSSNRRRQDSVLLIKRSKTSYIRSQRDGTHYRYLWGKITSPHGNSGVVCAQFKSNLPAESMGRKVRVFMYPSSI